MKKFVLIAAFLLFLCGCTPVENVEEDGGLLINPSGNTLETRICVPAGFERTLAEGESLADFLRNYEMKAEGAEVLLYNGTEKGNQSAHMAVFKLPIENENLQQCADSVMRIYAEYLWQSGRKNEIAFHFTDGFLCNFEKWSQGYRVSFAGNEAVWTKSTGFDDSYENLVKYLRMVFSYAGTASMEAYETEEISLSELEVGDVILKGGSPGHVVMVADVCENADGEKAFLLAQGYMPAQEFHIIKNPRHNADPWYYESEMVFPLRTAEYTFENENMLRRLNFAK